jgi:hypothetical protein
MIEGDHCRHKGKDMATMLEPLQFPLSLPRCLKDPLAPSTLNRRSFKVANSKWRTTSFILNRFFFMTSAYPQTDFARFRVWRASKKNGGIVRPIAFSP